MKNVLLRATFFLSISFLLTVLGSCTKDETPQNNTGVVVIETAVITDLTESTVTAGGNITDDGGTTITERGVCYAVDANPVITNNKIADAATGAGSFTISITGLTANTTYHVRAYCTNSAGTSYGNDVSFTTNHSAVISTIAGTGSNGYNGDNIPANTAQLDNCKNLAVDQQGNIYLSDGNNHIIRKITGATGTISLIAGTPGVHGYTGDNGPAVNATLYGPNGITVDAAGNIFFADGANNCIRKIAAGTGIITTVAGGVFSLSPFGDGGPATAACLGQPTDVETDATGNLFIADWAHHKIRRVDAVSHIITTIAGDGSQVFNGDGGLATAASVQYPESLALSSTGELLIVSHYRVRKIDNAGIITSIAGNGNSVNITDNVPATSSAMWPTGITTDNAGNIYLADYGNKRIRKINVSGIINTVAGNGDYNYPNVLNGYSPLSACLDYPTDIAVDASGNLYIADYGESRIRKVTY